MRSIERDTAARFSPASGRSHPLVIQWYVVVDKLDRSTVFQASSHWLVSPLAHSITQIICVKY